MQRRVLRHEFAAKISVKQNPLGGGGASEPGLPPPGLALVGSGYRLDKRCGLPDGGISQATLWAGPGPTSMPGKVAAARSPRLLPGWRAPCLPASLPALSLPPCHPVPLPPSPCLPGPQRQVGGRLTSQQARSCTRAGRIPRSLARWRQRCQSAREAGWLASGRAPRRAQTAAIWCMQDSTARQRCP